MTDFCILQVWFYQKIQNDYKLIDYSIKILKEEIQSKIADRKKVYVFITNEKSDKNV